MMNRKNWYNIRITPVESDKEPYSFMIETSNINSAMDKYTKDKEGTIVALWEVIR